MINIYGLYCSYDTEESPMLIKTFSCIEKGEKEAQKYKDVEQYRKIFREYLFQTYLKADGEFDEIYSVFGGLVEYHYWMSPVPIKLEI